MILMVTKLRLMAILVLLALSPCNPQQGIQVPFLLRLMLLQQLLRTTLSLMRNLMEIISTILLQDLLLVVGEIPFVTGPATSSLLATAHVVAVMECILLHKVIIHSLFFLSLKPFLYYCYSILFCFVLFFSQWLRKPSALRSVP
jgi:hypothetical protein